MASKYSSEDTTATIRVIDDSPLAAGLVGQAYEDSFAKEDREIKRGTNTSNTRSPKKGGRRGEEQSFRDNSHKRGLKSSQANKHGFEKPVKNKFMTLKSVKRLSLLTWLRKWQLRFVK